ncbi:glycoside hydrolase family 2 TIM barrel-domain containing protein [Sediminibacterium ginsengisoli]|uniref:Beta-galactosidase n=1 Tax=Sediminibacterium ginsengisoli TaxID=413434 RepID=A0A1T4RCU6_9BACT|nr:glycoside hydrolase family 2 TIM barrel-domain containing protein [Sediminibacterium ginsengisoli]SKA13636.1 beta-galactosidase [Sediminibacterium ginsengisoli]
MKLIKAMLSLLLLCCLLQLAAQEQARIITPLNNAWHFMAGADTDPLNGKPGQWKQVNLPHTWNIADVMDDTPGYYRGIGWYKKSISIPSSYRNKDVYLFFEGANQETEVFVNGKKAGNHTGGYSAFAIAVNNLLQFNDKDNRNEILVKVNNSHDPSIPPLSADFTFFGGIYRELTLVAMNRIHFNNEDHGSAGVFITTPYVNTSNAVLRIHGNLISRENTDRNILLSVKLRNREGKVIVTADTLLKVKDGITAFSKQLDSIRQPHLWTPEDPYLYTVTTTLKDAASGKLLDELQEQTGFRWFRFDAEKGFFLNGKPYKLVGASRHQDREGMGNAVSKKLAREDMKLLKAMGGNFLRVAHYPQDPAVLKACDELGLLASVEIPVVNEITESEAFYENCMMMQTEMIRQHYNHPSVIIWCYMNEILLRPHYNGDKPKQDIYFANITRLAQRLDSITRAEDPYRYTMIANHGDFNKYNVTGLTRIPMLVGWNLYSGWYGGTLKDFGSFLDRHRKELTDKPLLVTEYGADADPRIRSMKPVRFDKSVEYTTAFHQHYLTEMMKRPFVAAAVVWNLADFNSETREETMPHINNKGLLTWNRKAKDPYYYYQASLLKTPFIRIMSDSWLTRSGIADSATATCIQPVQVASNLDSVRLTVNGQPFLLQKNDSIIVSWNVPFINGDNHITATGYRNGRQYEDRLTVHFRLQPYLLKDKRIPFREINILLGANRYYIDEKRKQAWLPDQLYRPGSWGSVGGKPFRIEGNTRLPYGTDKNITGTDDDPVYQTQLTGIKEYKLDVADGNYELTLHFAELQGSVAGNLAYNLSETTGKQERMARVFDVYVNGKLFLEHFDLAGQYGIAKAVAKKWKGQVRGSKGLTISFRAVTGEPVLNALQLRKL